jgi:hypothetical protein
MARSNWRTLTMNSLLAWFLGLFPEESLSGLVWSD